MNCEWHGRKYYLRTLWDSRWPTVDNFLYISTSVLSLLASCFFFFYKPLLTLSGFFSHWTIIFSRDNKHFTRQNIEFMRPLALHICMAVNPFTYVHGFYLFSKRLGQRCPYEGRGCAVSIFSPHSVHILVYGINPSCLAWFQGGKSYNALRFSDCPQSRP